MNSVFGHSSIVALLSCLALSLPALHADAIPPSPPPSNAEMGHPPLFEGAVGKADGGSFTAGSVSCASGDALARVNRRAALVAELLDEGAAAEASVEAARLRADMPEVADAALAPLAAALAQAGAAATPPAVPASRGGVGGSIARGVVWFYRTFVGTAIGDRCVLQPSCSRYYLQASRKHGLLGIPMVADRFVREPDASAPDRPWVKTPSGEWRHPDPVEDHDFWFSSAPDSHR